MLLAMASITVSGCGGDSKSAATTYTIGGSVTGLTSAGLVLQDNGGNNLTVSANATSFAFSTPVASSGVYSVTVLTQPAGETCTVTGGSGTAAANVTNVSVACVPMYTIGGTITGLSETGLVLQDNGGDNLTVNANATSFTFAIQVAQGAAFNVTVLTQPLGENCTVTNGSGTASANVTNVDVACTQAYTINGTVTGLTATGLVLQDNGGGNLAVSANATSFTFAAPVLSGGAYSVTVLTQPANQSCTVANGSGTATADVTNVSVVCVGEWTWVGGSSTVGFNDGRPGVYGTLGVSSPTNMPGGREQSITWSDASGGVWLFGGYGDDSAGTGGQLNDLWKFDPALGSAGQWTWMSGSSVNPLAAGSGIPNGEPGIYGTLGASSPTNVPGGREQIASWKDGSGNLWLFGGYGIDANGDSGLLNDLWKFDPKQGAAGEWTWMGGSSTVPSSTNPFNEPAQPGVYGALGTASSTNIPGGRSSEVSWTDASGHFWLFGGLGADATGTTGYLNDLWMFDPELGATGEWTWMGGSSTIPSGFSGAAGVYGIQGTTASTNVPGARFSPVSWTDASGNLWLFGGQGYDWTGTVGFLNDLWKYTPNAAGDAGAWTWMGGSNTVGGNGGPSAVYGTLGTAASANTPGSRFGAAPWVDASGNLWLLGGQGYDGTGVQGYLNDVWRYQP
jgi:N-acetylneuraminic acid mutarotase